MHLNDLKIGDKIKDYTIEKYLGRGAMGVVYSASTDYLSQKVAIKFHDPSALNADPLNLKSFRNEANIMLALHHPNVVKGIELGTYHGLHYLVMEMVDGQSLHDILKEYGRIGVVRSLEIALELVEALDYCWDTLHLIHGDIKPENMMITRSGHLKLMDFGVAQADSFHNPDNIGILTPLYAAPETINKLPNTRLSDIYSFGATLYHLLAGHPPFPGYNPDQVMSNHLTLNPIPLHKCYSDIDEEISLFLLELLKKRPEDRPQTWQEIRQTLYQFCRKRELNDDNFSYQDEHKFNKKITEKLIAPSNQKIAFIAAKIPWRIIKAMVIILTLLLFIAYFSDSFKNPTFIKNNYTIIPYPDMAQNLLNGENQ